MRNITRDPDCPRARRHNALTRFESRLRVFLAALNHLKRDNDESLPSSSKLDPPRQLKQRSNIDAIERLKTRLWKKIDKKDTGKKVTGEKIQINRG